MSNTSVFRGKAARWAAGLGLAGLAAVSGTAAANAATTSATGTSTATSGYSASATPGTSTAGTAGGTRASMPAHGTAAEEALEKTVTGTKATTAGAAAVKAVGSGTATKVTTDASGNGYEVTVTKADGSTVEVHLNASMQIDDHGRLGSNVGDTSASTNAGGYGQSGNSATAAG